MIYRKRISKSEYGVKTTPNFLKIMFGKRVWYFERRAVFHTLISLSDIEGVHTVKHTVLSWRKTFDKTERGLYHMINYLWRNQSIRA